MNLELHIPKLDDYWYEEKLQSDPVTMSYNAGYDVSYYGYHYDTGCIDFPKSKWEEMYNKRKIENRFFAYIKDNEINEFVGYFNYHYNKNDNRYECGILIESKYRGKGYSKKALRLLCNAAKDNGISSLYDNFEIDRENTLKVFESVGFIIIEHLSWKKFDKNVNGVRLKPYLLKEVYSYDSNLTNKIYESKVLELNKVNTEQKYLDRVKEGFKAVLEYGGTGSGYIDRSYKPAGKTGTSQSFVDTDNNNIVDTETITNTFAAYAPYDNPKVAFVVVSPDISISGVDYQSSVNKRISKEVSKKYFEIYP